MTSSPSKKKTIPKIVFILLIALLLRLVFIYPQFSGDVKNHIVWGHSFLEAGPLGLYERHFSGYNDTNYPPVAIYLFGLSVFLNMLVLTSFHYFNNLIGIFPSLLVPLFAHENMQAAFLKLPSVFADLGIGYLIYLLSPKHKKLLSTLYLFNPAVIYVSTVWGQIESLPIFFLILSYYFLVRKKKCDYFFSHLAFVLAILSKQTALWLTPVFLIVWWKEGGAKKFALGLLFQLLLFIIIYLPFSSPSSAIISYLSTFGGSSNSITDQAFNLWYFIYGWAYKPDSLPLLGLTVRLWSIILTVIAYLALGYRYLKNSEFKQTGNYLFFLSLAAFFLQTRVHDRHLAPVLPFLLLSSFKLKLVVPLYLAISVFHMINLYLALRLPFL